MGREDLADAGSHRADEGEAEPFFQNLPKAHSKKSISGSYRQSYFPATRQQRAPTIAQDAVLRYISDTDTDSEPPLPRGKGRRSCPGF